MSTANLPKRLISGERLRQPEFHERYEAMPPGTWAELVGGLVYMPSPLRCEHADENTYVVGWLYDYQAATPGVRASINPTTILDDQGEPQPDVTMRILPELGGLTHYVEGYLAGPPELVVEVAKSSRHYDLGPKKADYERAGVSEYIVYAVEPAEVFYFIRRADHFQRLEPGPDGLYRSEIFPGLWLDPKALMQGDIGGLKAALARGLETPEHAAFVARLREAGGAEG